MGRSPCCEKDGLKKGPWTPEEDQKLLAYIEQHGHGCWRSLPAKAGLQRCRKSCRLRWTNYLRPDIKRGKFSLQEEQTIIRLHALLGNRWSAIAMHLPKRTDNEIKNYWNTHLKKRLAKMGIDPVTHKPRSDALGTCGGGAGGGAAGAQHAEAHTAQWESARLEAEAHMARAREARRLHALVASASATVSALPHMPRPAAARQLNSSTSLLSFSESTTHTSVLEALCADVAAARAAMPQPTQAHVEARKDHLRQEWGDHIVDVADADIAASASVSAPTSTLSFTETAVQASVLEDLRAAVAATHAAMPQPMQAHEEARKDHLQQHWEDHVVDVVDAEIAAAALAGMLLDDSLIQQQTEEEKKYWVTIMNLVNSPSASLQTSVATPALQASSSSAPLQTSVTMPAPKAYSSSASISTFVADCARARGLATLLRWTPDP